MHRDYDTYNNGKGHHSYDVYVGDTKDEINFNVIANNRDQAARRVERDGHKVRSVNMTG